MKKHNQSGIAVINEISLYNCYLVLLRDNYAAEISGLGINSSNIELLDESKVFASLKNNDCKEPEFDISSVFPDVMLNVISDSITTQIPASTNDHILKCMEKVPLSIKRQIFELHGYHDRLEEQCQWQINFVEALCCYFSHRLEDIQTRVTLFYSGVKEVLVNSNLFDPAHDIDSDFHVLTGSQTLHATGKASLLRELRVDSNSWQELGLLDSTMTNGIIHSFVQAYKRYYITFIKAIDYLRELDPLNVKIVQYLKKISSSGNGADILLHQLAKKSTYDDPIEHEIDHEHDAATDDESDEMAIAGSDHYDESDNIDIDDDVNI